MVIGYVREFPSEEDSQAQISFLSHYNCDIVYQERDCLSEGTSSILEEVLTKTVSGDRFVIQSLNVIGQNSSSLLSFINSLERKGVDFVSVLDGIDTSSEAGKLICHGLNCLFQFERSINRERTISGIKLAKQRGKAIGKPKGLSLNAKLLAQKAEALYHEGFSITQIATKLNISRQTIYKYLRHRLVQVGSTQ